jgi:1-acyl-sn-glycerol-3-phosphate acyltransferase
MKKTPKKTLIAFIGLFTYPLFTLLNKIQIKGMEVLCKLPQKKVLFVSNHQTYFIEVIAFYHLFSAAQWGKKKKLGIPYYLLNPFTEVNYVAAGTTMKSTFLARLFTLTGAITVKRTWTNSPSEERKGLDIGDTRNIVSAIEKNWVITFPQGTTTPFAPGRKGTAHIIKQTKALVVPIVIDGFSEAFAKKGVKPKKWNTQLSINIKPPLVINYENSVEEIMSQIMDAIEQSEAYKPLT